MTFLTLTACQNTNPVDDKSEDTDQVSDTMTIKSAVLSDETQDLLYFIDGKYAVYDLNINDEVKSATMCLWTYENDAWVQNSSIKSARVEKNMRIVIYALSDNFSFGAIGQDEKWMVDAGKVVVDFKESLGSVKQLLAVDYEPQLNQEMTLWLKLSHDNEQLELGDFRNIKCNEGFAVTLTLSDQEVDY